MVIYCSGNVGYVSLKGLIGIECHSQISGVRVGCYMNVSVSLHIREGVGVLISNDENHCFFVIQLEHVSFQPLADTGDREFHFTMAILGEVLSLRLNSWGNWVSSAYRW